VIRYYVLRQSGEVRRLAKIVDNSRAYGYEGGAWVDMSNLLRILYEITDYEEISEAEARAIIEEVYRE
jgi:hypothetical protein